MSEQLTFDLFAEPRQSLFDLLETKAPVDEKSILDRLRNVWYGMKRRCFTRSHKSYMNYGGRGITICKEWLILKNFQKWSMANGYHRGLQIDRIDNDGNYCPENCRWVTPAENSRNKRSTILVNLHGVDMCFKDACEKVGANYSSALERLNMGYTPERAVLTPSRHRRPYACFHRTAKGDKCHFGIAKETRYKAQPCPYATEEEMRECPHFYDCAEEQNND